MIDIVNRHGERQSEGIVLTRHQFLMEQAGRTRCLRRPTATKLASKESRQGRARFFFQNLDQDKLVKPFERQK